MATSRYVPGRLQFISMRNSPVPVLSILVITILFTVVNTSVIEDRVMTETTLTVSTTSSNQVNVNQYNSSNDSYLPTGWQTFCTNSETFVDWEFSTLTETKVNRMMQISCQLSADSINFVDFRRWSEHQNDTKIALKVVCGSPDGSFHLPWPMKAKNLVFIKVQGCKLDGFYSEYFSEEITQIPDEIRVLYFENTTTMLNPMELYDVINKIDEKGLSTAVSCGPLTLEQQAFIGCSSELSWDYDYGVDENIDLGENIDVGNHSPGTTMKMIDWDDASDSLWNGFRDLNAKCNYRNMLSFVETHGKQSQTGIYFRLLTEHSMYPKLQTLDLSHNDFFVIPEELQNWGRDFPKLEYLDLSHNKIYRIDFWDNGFAEDGVGRINLRNNNITTLTVNDILILRKFKSVIIDISNNPINCECGEIKELYNFQAEKDLGHYEYLRDLVCQSPRSLVGRNIRDLTPEEVICQPEPPKFQIILIVVLSGAIVVLGIIIILLLRYRREFVILVYTRLHIILPCQPVDSCEGKSYDAFISYSSKDDDWVLKTLVQRLENNENGEKFKLCVHHRDFEIGAAIADNVVQSVESSRHTVMVLSRNYVQSEWCIYEFRTAMHQSLIEKKKHLIVILLDNVPKSELDNDLRKCLETFTYIQVGEKLFWDKIQYSLGHKNKPKTSSTSSQNGTDSGRYSQSDTTSQQSSKVCHVSMFDVV